MADDPKVCSRCQGRGFLPVPDDDTIVMQCICAYARLLKAHLGPEIATTVTLSVSPLFEPGEPGEPPVVDRTHENLFLKGAWQDILPHLKWALGCKGPMFPFRMVTDEKLKVVYVGAESYAAKAKGSRDTVITYNSLADLIGPDQDLVIIRLGFLGHKNIAMAGILKEALMIREFACKPTWLVDMPEVPFGMGHFAFSEENASYIASRYTIVNVAPVPGGRHTFSHEPPVIFTDGEDVGMGGMPSIMPEPAPRGTFPESARPRRVTTDSLPEIEMPGENRKTYKPNKKRGSGGGGPV